jgi:hypothetical protein
MSNEACPSRPTVQPFSPEQIRAILAEQTRRLDEAHAMLLEARSWTDEKLSKNEAVTRAFVMRQRFDRVCDLGVRFDGTHKPKDSRGVSYEIEASGLPFSPSLGVDIDFEDSPPTKIWINPYQTPHEINVLSFMGNLDKHNTRTAARVAEAFLNAIVQPVEETLGLPKLPDPDRYLRPEIELDLYLGG